MYLNGEMPKSHCQSHISKRFVNSVWYELSHKCCFLCSNKHYVLGQIYFYLQMWNALTIELWFSTTALTSVILLEYCSSCSIHHLCTETQIQVARWVNYFTKELTAGRQVCCYISSTESLIPELSPCIFSAHSSHASTHWYGIWQPVGLWSTQIKRLIGNH